jgi:hypothetical protein
MTRSAAREFAERELQRDLAALLHELAAAESTDEVENPVLPCSRSRT